MRVRVRVKVRVKVRVRVRVRVRVKVKVRVKVRVRVRVRVRVKALVTECGWFSAAPPPTPTHPAETLLPHTTYTAVQGGLCLPHPSLCPLCHVHPVLSQGFSHGPSAPRASPLTWAWA